MKPFLNDLKKNGKHYCLITPAHFIKPHNKVQSANAEIDKSAMLCQTGQELKPRS